MSAFSIATFFISHGGGPWPWVDGPMRATHDKLAASLQQLPQQVGVKPKAVLMISAHWEEPEFTVMAHPNPPMLYDYSNFPENTYRVQYPAPGAPQLAGRVRGLLEAAGIAARLDAGRGFDHGAFVPMAVMYPQADVPLLQLSLKAGLDPRQHLAAGRALAPLRKVGVLIIGSGLSWHNLRMMGAQAKQPSAAFDAWLARTLAGTDPAQRSTELIAWDQAPAARLAHPREEHLLPLMVALGAAEGDAATRIHHEDSFFGGAAISSYIFGSTEGRSPV